VISLSLFAALVGFTLLPIAVVFIYVAVWPGVQVRPMAVGVVGAILGLVWAAATLYWASLPLTRIGISSGAGSAGSSIGHLLGWRLLSAVAFVAVFTAATAWLLARALGNR
jgi:hypothetical protein